MRDLTRLPKAHLHVHLESSVRPDTLREIAEANGVPVPSRMDGDRFVGFGPFGEYNAAVRECLRRPSDFTRIAAEFCEDEAAQGTRYVELTFTAAAHGERLGDPSMPLEAVLAGLSGSPIEVRLLLDHSRRRSVDRARLTVELAKKYAPAVVAVGVAGDEAPSLVPFASVFEEARAAGLHIVHHAGETAGPDSIREAIDAGTERIGHGIRVLDDPELTASLAASGVPLEVCPSSNVTLGLVPSLASHPLPRLVEAGLVVTLNTDIPSVTGTTLTDEFRLAREVFGYSDAELANFATASVDASFASSATKARLRGEIADWLITEPG
jgi:adenosine deaminase